MENRLCAGVVDFLERISDFHWFASAFRATLDSRDHAALNSSYFHQGAIAHKPHGRLLRTTDSIYSNPSLTRHRY